MLERSFSKEQLEGTIACQRNHIESLTRQLAVAKKTLKGIRDHEHMSKEYFRTADYLTQHGTFNILTSKPKSACYADGIHDGHRCCSVIAADGLAKIESVQ